MSTRSQGNPSLLDRIYLCGEGTLSTPELVALLIGRNGAAHKEAELASRLLRDGGGLRAVACRTAAEWSQESGVGWVRGGRLAAAFELTRRAGSTGLRRGALIRTGEDVHDLLSSRLRDSRREMFIVLLLDGRHRLLREELVSVGTLTSSLVHPREVFGPALRVAAAFLVVAHNHPSGDPSPSQEDIEVTRRLAETGWLLGVPLLDHVIVGDRRFVSLRERGFLPAAGER